MRLRTGTSQDNPRAGSGSCAGSLYTRSGPAPARERPGERGRVAPPPAPPPPHLGGPEPRFPGLRNWSPVGGSGARGGPRRRAPARGVAGEATPGPGRRHSGSRPACSPPLPNLTPRAGLLGAGHPPDARRHQQRTSPARSWRWGRGWRPGSAPPGSELGAASAPRVWGRPGRPGAPKWGNGAPCWSGSGGGRERTPCPRRPPGGSGLRLRGAQEAGAGRLLPLNGSGGHPRVKQEPRARGRGGQRSQPIT